MFGYNVTYLYPNDKGIIDPQDVKKALRNDTLLVSIMMVNNEIGAVNDISSIANVVKKNAGTYFHSDITQALGKIDIDLNNVDMASFSAHKIHGLKGSGGLYKRDYIELLPIISGGQQEYSMRGGTSNALVNIVLAKTIRIALERKDSDKEYFFEGFKLMLSPGENIDNFHDVLNEYHIALKAKEDETAKLYDEIKIIKKLKV